jgi:hypothetical protein
MSATRRCAKGIRSSRAPERVQAAFAAPSVRKRSPARAVRASGNFIPCVRMKSAALAACGPAARPSPLRSCPTDALRSERYANERHRTGHGRAVEKSKNRQETERPR